MRVERQGDRLGRRGADGSTRSRERGGQSGEGVVVLGVLGHGAWRAASRASAKCSSEMFRSASRTIAGAYFGLISSASSAFLRPAASL